MADKTPEQKILDNALAPKRMSGDTGSAEQHSIQDQIAALELAKRAAATRRSLGIRHIKLIPPGSD